MSQSSFPNNPHRPIPAYLGRGLALLAEAWSAPWPETDYGRRALLRMSSRLPAASRPSVPGSGMAA